MSERELVEAAIERGATEEEAMAEAFGTDTPTAAKAVNVTNVNPYLPSVDPDKVQIPFAVLALLVCLSTLAVGEFIGLLVIR